jgi:hypothetical protein
VEKEGGRHGHGRRLMADRVERREIRKGKIEKENKIYISSFSITMRGYTKCFSSLIS